jgi:hypothetical protein
MNVIYLLKRVKKVSVCVFQYWFSTPVCLSKSVDFWAHLKLLQSGELSKRGILCVRHFPSEKMTSKLQLSINASETFRRVGVLFQL